MADGRHRTGRISPSPGAGARGGGTRAGQPESAGRRGAGSRRGRRSARASMPSSGGCTPSGPRSRTCRDRAARIRPARPSTSRSSPAPIRGASPPAPRRSSRRASRGSSTRPRTRPTRPPAAGPGCSATAGWRSSSPEVPEAAAARLLNQPFRKRARTGRPLVTYKAAMTLDGRVASPSGDSRWISSVESRELVHRWRSECDAVAVGIGTALADDPLLTASPRGRGQAARSGGLRLPRSAARSTRRWSSSIDEAPLIVVCAPEAAVGPAGRARGRGRRGDRGPRPH